MSGLPGRTLEALQLLLRSSHLAGPDELPGLASAAGRTLGSSRTTIYVVDYDQLLLVPLTPRDDHESLPIRVDSTIGGTAYRNIRPQLAEDADGFELWVPLIDGTERLGVLETRFTQADDRDVRPDADLIAAVSDLATLLAELTVTRSSYGDLVESTRRQLPLTLAAEMQWRLLPPLTFVSERVSISGVLAPTAEVAGDSFDYALNGNLLHVALLDAMGHGLEAAVIATVAVAALRNARREGNNLPETARAVETAIAGSFGPEKFLTGIVGELDVDRGLWRWATCGHPSALLIHDGRVLRELDEVTGPPLGLGLLEDGPAVAEVQLQPGDRVLLYTDGVTEARDQHGEFFTAERLADFVNHGASREQPIAETLRQLNLAILAHQSGLLQDDATTVMLEWLGDQAESSTPPTAQPPSSHL